jgi:hypothetical protein
VFNLDRIGNHCITRCGANSFADAIRKPDCQHVVPVTGKREQRTHQRRERITTDDEKLPFAESIAQVTGE